jgi:hypothetical protein
LPVGCILRNVVGRGATQANASLWVPCGSSFIHLVSERLLLSR